MCRRQQAETDCHRQITFAKFKSIFDLSHLTLSFLFDAPHLMLQLPSRQSLIFYNASHLFYGYAESIMLIFNTDAKAN